MDEPVADDMMTIPAVRCDRFLDDADPALAYRVAHDTFPVLTDPVFVPAADAGFMRPDDWVVGVRVGGEVRCYPAYMLDNVHVVNDTIGGQWHAVMHCEICCSNAVFLAEMDGARVTFGTGGLFGGTLSIFDEQTKSLWSHGMGVAFDGPLAGRGLERVESFQATYAEWVALHPDTVVMTWPEPASHPDARHGHGTDAWFAQPGIEPLVLKTMSVREDERLPEHDMVVSLFTPDGHAALPLRELARAGGLIASDVAGNPLVTLSAGADSAMTGTFHPFLDDEPETAVELELRGGRFIDRETGSEFRVDGLAVSGPLAGRRLRPAPTMTNKWHSLICFVPGVEVVRAPEPVAVDVGALAPVLGALRGDGYSVEPTRRMYSLELPQEAFCGCEVQLNGEPFRVFLFTDESVAADQLLWMQHALQAGPVVLASNPPLWADWTNTRRIRGDAVAWSKLVEDPALRASLDRAAARVSMGRALDRASLGEFVTALRERGVQVHVRRSAYRETLPPGARSGMFAHIGGDPFLIYRFDSEEAAAAGAPLPAHSIVAGHLLLQSDPSDMYGNLERGTHRRPDELVSWSPLLKSAEFAAQVRAAAAQRSDA
ncbi:MAG TPA: DUF3179 domain-containing (seleno)protein [Longimicrobium sp.]